MSNLKINFDEAEKFIKRFSADGIVTFQTFADREDSEVRPFHETAKFEDIKFRLEKENQNGAGIFFMVNEGDGKGRSAKNVTKIRAFFVDLDGTPLEPVLESELKPDLIVESSLKRYHCYWFVDNCPLDKFIPVQKAFIDRFNGDKVVHDLPRVMRVPGFIHQKKEPFVSKVVSWGAE